ncbi:MAG: alpha-amylase family glycosyl hydrolase [Bacteroidota bacterium]|nr:alpha-amylase family glycosyl hydrolase [Bacteroidota bacterium]
MKRIAVLTLLYLAFAAAGHAQTPGKGDKREVPAWTRGVVWYRIVIDRFCNGDPSNDPVAEDIFPEEPRPWTVSRWTANWYELSAEERAAGGSFYENAFLRHYGGDLEGLRLKLGYLKSLGVTGLVLTPVFESHSAHKYDADSYHHIDPHLGHREASDTAILNKENPTDPLTWGWTASDRFFIEVLRAAHDSGFKVVLDIQPAHVGVNFWAFRDVLRNQEKSPYADWFTILEWDRPETPFKSEFSYRALWDLPAFPLFRKDSLGLAKGPRDYVFASVKRWMDPNGDGDPSDGVDGWWVETAGALPVIFWDQWVDFVKRTNPDAVVIGAPLKDASNKRVFDIEETDLFGKLVSRFMLNRKMTPTRFEAELSASRMKYPINDVDAQMLVIDNHETDRIASMCLNRNVLYDADNSPMDGSGYRAGKPDEAARRLQKLVTVFQMTYTGSPLIFYGDEAGMWGGDDPDCRKPMVWPDSVYDDEEFTGPDGETVRCAVVFDSAVYAWYRALLSLRSRHIALKVGSQTTLLLDDEHLLFAYMREAGADRVFVLLNAGDKPAEFRFPLPGVPEGLCVDAPLQNLAFYAERNGIALVLPPETAVVLVPRF